MDLEELRAFLAVVETGSFFSASTATGMSRTTIRRRVDALEARAGVTLLERSRRGVVVTAAGKMIARRGSEMLQETRALLDNVREVGEEPAGVVNVVAPAGMPTFVMTPWVRWIRRKFKGLRVVLRLVDDPVTYLLDGADIAMHFGPAPTGPWESTILVGGSERLLATQDYLDERGTPSAIGDLADHDLICATTAGEDPTRWPCVNGSEIGIEPVVTSSDLEVVIECVVKGGGIALLPTLLLARSEALRIVLSDEVGCERAIRITVPAVLKTIPKIARIVEGTRSFYARFGGDERARAPEVPADRVAVVAHPRYS